MSRIFSSSIDAEHAFYVAFEGLDLAAMNEVWSPDESVVCIHPGGPLLSGTEPVTTSWGEIFAAAEPPQVSHRLIHRNESGDLAVHVVEEYIRPGNASSSEFTTVVATNVYRRSGESWLMIGHHASLPMVRKAPRGTHDQLH